MSTIICDSPNIYDECDCSDNDDYDDSDERGDYEEIYEEELPDLDKLLASNKEVPLPQAVRKSKHQFSILKGMYDRFKSKKAGTRDKSSEMSIGYPVLVANHPRAKASRKLLNMNTETKGGTDKARSVDVTGATGSDKGPDGGQHNYEPYDPYDHINPMDENDEESGESEDCEDGDGLTEDLIYDDPYQDHDFGKQNRGECESSDNDHEESFPKQDDDQESLPPPVHRDKKIQKGQKHGACKHSQPLNEILAVKEERKRSSSNHMYITLVDDIETSADKEEAGKSHKEQAEELDDSIEIDEKMEDDNIQYDDGIYWVNPECSLNTPPSVPPKHFDISGKSKHDHQHQHQTDMSIEPNLTTEPPKLYPKPASIHHKVRAGEGKVLKESPNDDVAVQCTAPMQKQIGAKNKPTSQTDMSIELNLTTEPPKLYPKPASIHHQVRPGEGKVLKESSNDDVAAQCAAPMQKQIGAKNKPSGNEHICDSSNTQDNQSMNDPSVGEAKCMTKQGGETTNDRRPVRELSIAEVGEVLQRLKLSKYAAVFEEELISGEILMHITQDIFESDLGMRRLDALKLNAFIKKGHIPK